MMLDVIETGDAYEMPELRHGLGVMQAHVKVGPAPRGMPRAPEISTVYGQIAGIAGFRSALW